MALNRYKLIQFTKLGAVILLLVGIGACILYYQPVGDQSIFLITTLIAVSPVVIFEIWNEMKSPYVVVSDIHVVDFPNVVFDYDNEEAQVFNNGICVRVHVKNIGFETAKECTCEVKEELSNEKFPARWSIGGINPLNTDLSPNEEQFVDTIWYQYNGGSLAVPTNIEQKIDFGSKYQKSNPAGLNELSEGQFRLLIRASNMPLRSDEIPLLGKQRISLPDDLFDAKEFNPYTQSLLEKGHVAYAYAISPHDWELYVPEDFDLHELANMPFLDEVLFDEGTLVPDYKRPVQIRTIQS